MKYSLKEDKPVIKRISLILALALLAALLGGCRFAVVETDSVQIVYIKANLNKKQL